MEKSVTAPLGAHRLAGEFLSAALKVSPVPSSAAEELRRPLSLVGYYLVGHSVELSLEAFLLGRGVAIAKLRNKPFGHNLVSLVSEARRRKLGLVVKLSRQELLVLSVLNECYSAKELEYSVTGLRRLPRYPLAVALASKLLKELAPYCRKLAANNSSKPTPLRGAA
ncbi:hypothetical protein [Cognatilysobacter lacus]|uniref:HEPN domain-containing protein n=1 Tax=Cognatilysobacter lacus TaxID=1643323 RepID=A0A5D8YEU0_9GAMM|nr:hypothetical protein [Lysobacter lacus]TZF80717.1 hypothetical protein FW784_13855 [Lysobacter lacus]